MEDGAAEDTFEVPVGVRQGLACRALAGCDNPRDRMDPAQPKTIPSKPSSFERGPRRGGGRGGSQAQQRVGSKVR
jgi:hypothetical protein